jgi:hypothetical protein
MSIATLEERCIWRLPGMPHKGWTLLGVEDLEEPEHTCEACGKTEIRYVHEIAHPGFRTLLVGCVCSMHLTQDYVNPKRLEQDLRNAASRRKREVDRLAIRLRDRRATRDRIAADWEERHWGISKKGNPWTKPDGLLVVVFPSRGGYGCNVGDYSSQAIYPDEDAAKEAALNGFLFVHQKGD